VRKRATLAAIWIAEAGSCHREAVGLFVPNEGQVRAWVSAGEASDLIAQRIAGSN
jgi:hypothetical protein